jgi:two-component system sensor histidine kinase/response regulator
MESYKLRVPILEFLYRKPGVNLPKLYEEAPDNLEYLIQDAFSDLQRSEARLYQHIATLQAKNKELDTYASMVAHDLKDPLYAMLLTSTLITSTPDLTSTELKKYLQQITSTAHQMKSIINNLLLFAKVNNIQELAERVNMDQAVANALDRLQYTIQERHAQIDIPEVWPPWIEEVWANYLSNALKHGIPPPQIALGASTQVDGMVRYWIRDNGPGISTHDQAQLFRPFSQIDNTCNSGNGLGLSIVQRIVEKLGGQAGCESELGKGSLFFFTLPADLLVP